MWVVFLVCMLVVCSGQHLKRCSDCPDYMDPCDQIFSIRKENCTCSVCVTRCSVRYQRCMDGDQCTEAPWDYSANVQVAKCEPFTECQEDTCHEDGCPVSGYFLDKNGCNTCLCNDPCAELQCPNNGCIMWSTSTFEEPNYECDGNN